MGLHRAVADRTGAPHLRRARGARILGQRALTVQGPLVTVGSDLPYRAHPSCDVSMLPLLLAVVLLFGAVMAGCAGAPVQEMSNARQAVRAAERAGAATAAPGHSWAKPGTCSRTPKATCGTANTATPATTPSTRADKAVEARRIAESRPVPHRRLDRASLPASPDACRACSTVPAPVPAPSRSASPAMPATCRTAGSKCWPAATPRPSTALCNWLWQGSPASSVTAVEVEELPPTRSSRGRTRSARAERPGARRQFVDAPARQPAGRSPGRNSFGRPRLPL